MIVYNIIKDKKELRKFFISDDDYEVFLKELQRNSKIMRLVDKVSESERSHDYCNIIKYKSQIEDEVLKMIQRYVDLNKERKEQIDISVMPLSEEEKQTLAEQTVSICMCCDMIESFCMRIDELLKPHSDIKLTQFLRLNDVLRETKSHIRWLQDETELRNYSSWGSACDFYIDSIPKRAAKLMKAADDKRRKANKK